VELKAVSQLLPEHEAQLMNYIRITKLEVGYLINFGNTEKLEWKRFIVTNHRLSLMNTNIKPLSVTELSEFIEV